MEGPSELLRRAARNRRGAPPAPREPERTRTAPAPPRVQAHHDAYAALMRRHDRIKTCHLPVQGGKGRA